MPTTIGFIAVEEEHYKFLTYSKMLNAGQVMQSLSFPTKNMLKALQIQ